MAAAVAIFMVAFTTGGGGSGCDALNAGPSFFSLANELLEFRRVKVSVMACLNDPRGQQLLFFLGIL